MLDLNQRQTLSIRRQLQMCRSDRTEGSLAPVACLESRADPCPRMAGCRTLPMWQKLDTLINEYLDGVTLADLMVSVPQGGDYVI